jgi:signal transduction histidine kinase
MQRLLADLLDLARLRSGRLEMEVATFDAREVANQLAEELAPMAAARDQRLVVEVPDRPVEVRGDQRRLEQAVLNLVSNAQKFSGPGSEVTLRVSRDDGGTVRWSVIDRGPGIGPDERDRLFERFFVGTSDRRAAGGSGIGLPTALAIAQAHGGTIEVESELGAGSAFHVVVPSSDGP